MIRYGNKSYQISSIYNYLNSINDFVRDYNISGYFEAVCFNNPNKLKERGIEHSYHVLYKVLRAFHIFYIPTEKFYDFRSFRKGRNADTYTVIKPIYLMWYAIANTMRAYDRNDLNIISKYKIKFDLTDIANEIVSFRFPNKGLIKREYLLTIDEPNKTKKNTLENTI